jgi:hypothetical protein
MRPCISVSIQSRTSERRMQVRLADGEDVAVYAAFARAAQAWLRSRGLGQYVPAAHDQYTASIQSQVASKTLFAVQDGGETCGFFSLHSSPPRWWPADETSASYLAGMVVARSAGRRGIASRGLYRVVDPPKLCSWKSFHVQIDARDMRIRTPDKRLVRPTRWESRGMETRWDRPPRFPVCFWLRRRVNTTARRTGRRRHRTCVPPPCASCSLGSVAPIPRELDLLCGVLTRNAPSSA